MDELGRRGMGEVAIEVSLPKIVRQTQHTQKSQSNSVCCLKICIFRASFGGERERERGGREKKGGGRVRMEDGE